MTPECCGSCGNATIVDGGCASCGAGVSYRRPWHRGPKKPAKHAHEWGFEGMTTETGVRARREVCTKKRCKAFRLQEVE